MKSKNIVLKATLCLFTMLSGTAVVAQSSGNFYEGGYIEGHLGYASGPDVDTETFTGTIGDYEFTDFGLTGSYDDDVSFGLELGVRLQGPIRVGLGITRFNFDFDKLGGSGTIVGPDVDVDLSGASISRSELGPFASELDTDATLFSLNTYYDFNEIAGFEPFVGIGLGVTDIEDTKDNEFTGSLYAGVKYGFADGMYVGGRVAYHKVNGPEDSLGIKYDDFDVTTVSLIVGYDF